MPSKQFRYEFSGDATPLRKAVGVAVASLEEYEMQISKLAKTGQLKLDAKGLESYRAAVERIKSQAGSLSKTLIDVASSGTRIKGATAAINNAAGAIASLRKGLFEVRSGGVKSIEDLSSALDSATSKLGDAERYTKTFASSFTGQFQTGIGQAASKAAIALETPFEEASKRIGSAVEKITAPFNKVGSKVGSAMTSVSDHVKNAASRITSYAGKVAADFKLLIKGADGVDEPTKDVADAAEEAGKAMKKETSEIDKEKKSLDNKNKSLKKSGSQHKSLAGIISDLGNKIKSETKNINLFAGAFGTVGAAISGLAIGSALGEAITTSIDYVETLNLFQVALGDSVDAGREFVAAMEEMYGLDTTSIMQAVGMFSQLTTATGTASDTAATLSMNLAKAAVDMSSLFNKSYSDVITNLTSGIQGETEAVRKYGIDIRTTTLQQTAYALGIDKSVESMTEASRQGLRYLTLMGQISKATGDFARTVEQPANQLKVFKEQVIGVARNIGNLFMPALQAILPYINGFMMALKAVIGFLSTLVGYDASAFQNIGSGISSQTSAVGALGDEADSTANKLKDLIAPFDELNVLNADTGSGGGSGDLGIGGAEVGAMDPAIAAAIDEMGVGLENIRMKANDVRDALLEFFGFDYVSVFNPNTGEWESKLQWFPDAFERNLIAKFPQWTKTIQALFDNWGDIVDGFKNVWDAIVNVVKTAVAKVAGFIGQYINDDTVSAFIEGLAGSLNSLSSWINNNSDMLANFVIAIAGMATAFQLVGTAVSVLSPVISTLSTLWSIVSNIGGFLIGLPGQISSIIGSISTFMSTLGPIASTLLTVAGAIAAVVAVLAIVYALNEDFRNSVNDLFGNIFQNNVLPLLDDLEKAWDRIIEVVKAFWDFIEPVLINLGNELLKLWETTVKPFIANVAEALQYVIEIILGLWNNILAPLVTFILKVLGPSFEAVCNVIIDAFSWVVGVIGGIVNTLLDIFNGILQFLSGIFTGDVEKILKGIGNIIVGILNGIIGVVEAVVNFIITGLNLFLSLFVGTFIGMINTVVSTVEGVLDFVGVDWEAPVFTVPQIETVTFGRVAKLATGGVVDSPTNALIGEGRYSEAVVPLDDSPQMNDLIQKIADATNNKGGDKPVEVRVYIGDKEWDAFTYKSAERGKKIVGNQPIKEDN